jgi:hypothetical protein
MSKLCDPPDACRDALPASRLLSGSLIYFSSNACPFSSKRIANLYQPFKITIHFSQLFIKREILRDSASSDCYM